MCFRFKCFTFRLPFFRYVYFVMNSLAVFQFISTAKNRLSQLLWVSSNFSPSSFPFFFVFLCLSFSLYHPLLPSSSPLVKWIRIHECCFSRKINHTFATCIYVHIQTHLKTFKPNGKIIIITTVTLTTIKK